MIYWLAVFSSVALAVILTRNENMSLLCLKFFNDISLYWKLCLKALCNCRLIAQIFGFALFGVVSFLLIQYTTIILVFLLLSTTFLRFHSPRAFILKHTPHYIIFFLHLFCIAILSRKHRTPEKDSHWFYSWGLPQKMYVYCEFLNELEW